MCTLISPTRTMQLGQNLTVGYRQIPSSPDLSKPTLILLHSFDVTLDLYEPQFKDKKLLDTCNLLAIDEIGHGQTSANPINWTYWDTAHMVLDMMDKLSIKKAFVLGTAQGGFICVRMALLQPSMVTMRVLLYSCSYMIRLKKVAGLILVGTSVYAESEESRQLGCWNAKQMCQPWFEFLDSTDPTPDFEVPDCILNAIFTAGWVTNAAPEVRQYWTGRIQKKYAGDEGRKILRQCTICLLERDGFESRLKEIVCPTLIIHVRLYSLLFDLFLTVSFTGYSRSRIFGRNCGKSSSRIDQRPPMPTQTCRRWSALFKCIASGGDP